MSGRAPSPGGRRRPVGALVALVVGLAVAVVASMLAGSVAIGLGDVAHALAVNLGLVTGERTLADSVVWAIRLPRVLGGALVGAALGLSGAALQGAFRNRMADPQLLGISPAAGLGAIAGIAVTPLGGPRLVAMLGAATAAIGGLWLMRKLARRIGASTEFILVGLAVGLSLLAWLAVIVVAWDDPRVPTFSFWVFGSLATVTWQTLGAATPVFVLGVVIVTVHMATLDLVALGETEARHLGVAVERLRAWISAGVGLLVGAAVGTAGVIGFVGLVVPSMLRPVVGPGHRWLIALSGIGGALALVALDVVARTVAAPIEIPVGLLAAAIGGPVFVWLLLGKRRAWL